MEPFRLRIWLKSLDLTRQNLFYLAKKHMGVNLNVFSVLNGSVMPFLFFRKDTNGTR
jgi:hypothetical protein